MLLLCNLPITYPLCASLIWITLLMSCPLIYIYTVRDEDDIELDYVYTFRLPRGIVCMTNGVCHVMSRQGCCQSSLLYVQYHTIEPTTVSVELSYLVTSFYSTHHNTN